MAGPDTAPLEEELLEKKPFHPVETTLLILSTLCLIGSISFSSSHLFGRYLIKAEDAEHLDAGRTPADAALDRVGKSDDEMARLIQKYRPARTEE